MGDRRLGYVVVEYNQASRWPSLWSQDTLYDDKAEAREFRDLAKADARSRGRMESYTVAEVIELDEDET